MYNPPIIKINDTLGPINIDEPPNLCDNLNADQLIKTEPIGYHDVDISSQNNNRLPEDINSLEEQEVFNLTGEFKIRFYNHSINSYVLPMSSFLNYKGRVHKSRDRLSRGGGRWADVT